MTPDPDKQPAQALRASDPDAVAERNQRIVEDLRAAFQPLASRHAPETEPALILKWADRHK